MDQPGPLLDHAYACDRSRGCRGGGNISLCYQPIGCFGIGKRLNCLLTEMVGIAFAIFGSFNNMLRQSIIGAGIGV